MHFGFVSWLFVLKRYFNRSVSRNKQNTFQFLSFVIQVGGFGYFLLQKCPYERSLFKNQNHFFLQSTNDSVQRSQKQENQNLK